MHDTWTDLAMPLFSIVDFALDAPLSALVVLGAGALLLGLVLV